MRYTFLCIGTQFDEGDMNGMMSKMTENYRITVLAAGAYIVQLR